MKTPAKILHWAPRIISIVSIMFISLFALDSFNPDLTIGQQLAAFLIHLIPSFILTALLIVSWKWELLGGILYIIIGVGASPIVFLRNYKMNHSAWMSLIIILIITVPFVIVGILFIMSHNTKKGINHDV